MKKVPSCFKPTDECRRVVGECDFELVTNFEAPAKAIMEKHAVRLRLNLENFEAVRDFIHAQDKNN